MRIRIPLLASMCLATITLTPLAASAAPASVMTSISTSSADTHAVTYYGWRDREWRRERQYRHGGYCERLRRACVYKNERGEVGEGNCRRYRSECGRRYY